MIKLTDLILEATTRPKVVIMAGGSGAGKTYLLNQLELGSLPQVNPDKYIEDPDHPAYNNLGQGARLADQEAEELADEKTSFVWDTTASNPKKVQAFLDKGYDVYMTKGNLSIFINDRGGKFDKEVEAFNTAAKNGPKGIKDYLKNYNEKNGIGGSTFFKPVEMSKQEEEEFLKAVKDVDYDRSNRSEDKAIKQAFLKSYKANGVGPGDDKLRDAVKKYRDRKEKNDKRAEDVLENIAELLFSPLFQKKLEHSTPQEIDSKVQQFLS